MTDDKYFKPHKPTVEELLRANMMKMEFWKMVCNDNNTCDNCPYEGSDVDCKFLYVIQAMTNRPPKKVCCCNCEKEVGYIVKHMKHVRTYYCGHYIILDDYYICKCKECGEIVTVPSYEALNEANRHAKLNEAIAKLDDECLKVGKEGKMKTEQELKNELIKEIKE